MNDSDSPAVLALRAKLQAIPRDGTDWSAWMRKNYTANIRAQRLREARSIGTHTDIEWAEIVDNFGGLCAHCGCLPVVGPCKDHITPISQGGSDLASNLQPLCRECNASKGGRNA